MERCSLVILNHNGETILPEALEAASSQGADELFVVDNASTDSSVNVCAHAGIRVVSADNAHQFITGLNAAFQSAQGPWVLFAQNDVRLAQHSLPAIRQVALRLGSSHVYQPVLFTVSGQLNHAGGRYRWPGIGQGYASLPTHEPYRVDLFSTACFLMHQRLFELVGPFDTAFAPAYYEDVDYALRMRHCGATSLVVPSATGIHLSTFSFHRSHTTQALAHLCQVHRHLVVDKHYRGLHRFLRHLALSVLDGLSSSRTQLHGDVYRLGDQPAVTGSNPGFGETVPSPPR